MVKEAIGYRVSPDGSRIPLHYGEIKINADDQYHVIPRTRRSDVTFRLNETGVCDRIY